MSGHADDPTISDDDSVLRRVPQEPNFVVWDEQTGAERPSTGSFRVDEDGVSVFLLSVLRDLPDPCRSVADADPDRPGRCIELPVGACRDRGMGVARDPVDEPPLGTAHALILAPAEMGKRRFQKQLAEIARFCA
ncbi:MAG TPA: hypothetical protein P5544_14545 [Candidatus Nanopelagicales bacterium]|nr:hypothetical protein [Candidatus Nanopelagicales bacterium]